MGFTKTIKYMGFQKCQTLYSGSENAKIVYEGSKNGNNLYKDSLKYNVTRKVIENSHLYAPIHD